MASRASASGYPFINGFASAFSWRFYYIAIMLWRALTRQAKKCACRFHPTLPSYRLAASAAWSRLGA